MDHLVTNAADAGHPLSPLPASAEGAPSERPLSTVDRIGLLFFMVPGVLAYAVDFATGTLYLPKISRHGYFDLDRALAIDTGAAHSDEVGIRQAIQRHTGHNVSMRDPALRVRHAESTRWQRLRDALDPAQFAAFTVAL